MKSTINRRKVLKSLAAAGGISVASFPVAGEGSNLYVEQDGECWEVTPLANNDETICQFYGYSDVHSHTSTGIEEPDVSHLFLFEGLESDVNHQSYSEDCNGPAANADRVLSLVAIHDISSHGSHGSDADTGGGAVSFDFTGLPTDTGEWIVHDDHGDFNDGFGPSAPPNNLDWTWAARNTDGGAFEDLGDGNFDIEIDPAFNEAADKEPLDPGEISFWCFLSGNASDPNGFLLDKEKPVRVIRADSPPCDSPQDPPEDCILTVDIDIKPCTDPNTIALNNEGDIPVGIKGTSELNAQDIAVDTLRFGSLGNIVAQPVANSDEIVDTIPCDGDGTEDLVVNFPAEDAEFDSDDDLGKLKGELEDGTAIIGFDSVDVVESALSASFTVSPVEPTEGELVSFDASGSDGSIDSYEWDFDGDGSFDDATGVNPTHTFTDGGDKTVRLRVTDGSGASDTTSQTFHVNHRPTASFTVSPDPVVRNESVMFDAGDSSDQDGSVVSYEWDWDGDGTFEESTSDETTTHTFTTGGEHTVTLRVTDDDGATATTSTTFTVHIRAEIDIKPCSDPNAFNPDGGGVVPVGTKQTDDFDPTSRVAVDTLRFGAPDVVKGGDGATVAHDGHVEDVVPCEGDGMDDLVAHFPPEDTGFDGDEDNGRLEGETHDGVPLFGEDSVKLVGDGGGSGGNGGGGSGGNGGGGGSGGNGGSP